MGVPPFGATTFTSKLTSPTPAIVPLLAPMPWAVWHVEQVNPSVDTWFVCPLQLVLLPLRFKTTLRLWHLAHRL